MTERNRSDYRHLIFDSMRKNFWSLFTLHCFALIPVCIVGIVINIFAAFYLYRRTKRDASIRIYLLALTNLDALQLLFTTNSAIPYLCVYMARNGFCVLYRTVLFFPLRVISAMVDTVHMWTIVCITFHRYWKISSPLQSHVHDSDGKAKIILLLIAVSAFLFRFPMIFEYRLEMNKNATFFTETKYRTDKNYNMIYYFVLNTLLFNIIPFLTLTILNCLIVRTLHQARKAIRKDSVYRNREVRASLAICLIVTLFLAFHSLFIYDVVEKWKVFVLGMNDVKSYHVVMVDVSTLLAAISSTINPLIYIALGTGFRICHRTWNHWRNDEQNNGNRRKYAHSQAKSDSTSNKEMDTLILGNATASRITLAMGSGSLNDMEQITKL